jgi:hypothetical protein
LGYTFTPVQLLLPPELELLELELLELEELELELELELLELELLELEELVVPPCRGPKLM